MLPDEEQATALRNITENLVNFGNVVYQICKQTDRQTGGQANMLITILPTFHPSWTKWNYS